MSAELRGIIEAYRAVYDDGVKETLNSIRDEITEMDLTLITDEELSEIAESVLQELFEEGYSLFGAEVIFEDFISEARVTYGSDTQSPRAQKINRIKGAVRGTMNRAKETASSGAEKAFGKYRMAKDRLGKKITSTADTIKKTPGRVTTATKNTAEIAKSKVKSGLKSMVRRAAERVASGASNVAKRMSEGLAPGSVDPKLTTDRDMFNIKKSERDAARERLLAKTKAKMKKEEVSKIRKDWGDAYASIYEKKNMDPVGKEDGDIDNDGDKDSSDEYLMNRRKAIGKSMGKKGKCENCGGKGCEKCEDSIDEATRMAKLGYDETKLRNRAGGGKSADRATALEKTPTYGDDKAAKQRSDLARKQRGDFRKTASSGGSGSRFRSDDPTVKAKQRARAAQRGALTPNERRQLNMGEDFELFSEAELEAIQAKVDSWEG
jgi:hypothetical protein